MLHVVLIITSISIDAAEVKVRTDYDTMGSETQAVIVTPVSIIVCEIISHTAHSYKSSLNLYGEVLYLIESGFSRAMRFLLRVLIVPCIHPAIGNRSPRVDLALFGANRPTFREIIIPGVNSSWGSRKSREVLIFLIHRRLAS